MLRTISFLATVLSAGFSSIAFSHADQRETALPVVYDQGAYTNQGERPLPAVERASGEPWFLGCGGVY